VSRSGDRTNKSDAVAPAARSRRPPGGGGPVAGLAVPGRVTRPGADAPRADGVAVGYLLVAAVVFLVHAGAGVRFIEQAAVNVAGAVAICWSAARPPRSRAGSVVRAFYPLAFIGVAYVQVGLFAELIYGAGVSFDPLVAAWDRALFGRSPHLWAYDLLPGRFWGELMHGLYLLYFPLLFFAILYVRLRRPAEYGRFAFVFIGSFVTFVAIFIALPATGPLEYRAQAIPEEIALSRFVDFLYGFGIPSVGGALPSSHLGQSIVVFLLLRPMRNGPRILVLAVIAGIAVSMVYGSMHYAIDAVTGIPAGIALYYLWDGAWRALGRVVRDGDG